MLSPIDEIKNRLDIVEVISTYIKLRKIGANFRAICPFHSEKKPSFFVSPARQIWHCFGCGKGGNLFNFVMEIENVEFGDALRILAQKAGVELKPMKPELKTERQRLYEICELATKFFEKQLGASSGGKEAKEYLLNRGINEQSIKKWRLGYAPHTWEGLSDFLVSQGYTKEEVEKAGLCIKTDQGSFYDRFRGRIIFSIFDLNSQVIGFGARIFNPPPKGGEGLAKYVNTPNTLLYDKSRVLYGLNAAKMEIRKKNQTILVEGYTDVILSHQSGIENVVSTSGTTLTPYQLKILKRYSENILTAFDMDLAGHLVTERGIGLSQTLGFNVKVITLPKNQDPAEVISQNPANWQKIIDNQKSILDFYFEMAFSKYDKKNVEGKKEISKIILPLIKRIPNKIEQSHWIGKLAKELEVKEADIIEELRKVPSISFQGEEFEQTEYPVKNQKSQQELLEERLVSLVLKFPQGLNLIREKKIFSPKIQKILFHLKENPNFDFQNQPEVSDFFNYLSLKADLEKIEEKEALSEIQLCLKKFQCLKIKNKLDQISKEIKSAEEEKDFKKIKKLTEEFNLLSKSLSDLDYKST